MVRNLIVVEATFKGVAGNYILDTGTSGMVLNARYFEGSPTGLTYSGITGGDSPVSVLSGSVTLGPHCWKNIYSQIVPMKLLENSLGIPIHGLIGAKLFRSYTLYIDFLSADLQLIETQKDTPASIINLYTDTEGIPFLSKSPTPIIPLQVENGPLLRCTIDTGAEINLISDGYRNRLSSYLSDFESKKVGGIGQRVDKMQVRLMTGVFINSTELQAMRTAFTDLQKYNAALSGPPIDGIIGTELLQQFKVAIDFRNRRLYLEPLGVTASVDSRK